MPPLAQLDVQALYEMFPEQVRDVLDFELLGNSVLLWAASVVLFVVLVLLLYWLRGLLRTRLARVAERRETPLARLPSDIARSTKGLTILVVAMVVATKPLHLPAELDNFMDGLVTAIIMLQVGSWGHRVLQFLIQHYLRRKAQDSPSLAALSGVLTFLATVILWAGILVFYLENIGVEVTSLLAGLGIGGIAIALALQNVLGDLLASFSIIMDRPFEIGDFIIVGSEHMGSVEYIGVKTTRLRSLGGEQLIFSNSDLLASRIRNYKRMRERRIVFGFGVIYQTSAEALESIPGIVREIITEVHNTRLDRVHFKAFGDSSLDFEAVYYVTGPDYAAYMDAQQAINLALVRRFEEAGISFAYPTRTVFLSGSAGGKETEPVAA